MGKRLRVGVAAFALLLAAPAAQAEEFESCWVTKISNPVTLDLDPVTRCRISGGSIVDYGDDTSVPSELSVQVGTDANGQCWFYTSAPTLYVILAQNTDGSAYVAYDNDPANPGGEVQITPSALPRCTSEPTASGDPSIDAWNYVMQYVHDPPMPEMSPRLGDGVTGMETFVGVDVPDVHTNQISSGSSTIEVHVEVSAVVVNWGDGTINTYPASVTALAGYPDGTASHVFETKAAAGFAITVEYDWSAEWRLAGGSWTALPVPNTSTALVYPVAEIISNLGP